MPAALRRIPPGALLAALVLVAAALLYARAVRVNVFSPDEEYFVDLARVLSEHFPRSLGGVPEVELYTERGLQRLLQIGLAVPLGVIGGPTGFALAHALLCLAFASAALPAYLLARGLRLATGWALLAAALVVALPWAVMSMGWMTEAVAYPAALWALWGIWRACLRAGWRTDLLAVALILVAGLARTSLLVLIVVPPAAVALHGILAGGSARSVVRRHRLLAAFAALGVVSVAISLIGGDALGGLSGGYQTSLTEVNWRPLPEKFAGQLAPIAVGLGLIPAILGVPWILSRLVRRRRAVPEELALAVVALLALPVVLLSTIYAPPEERYLIYGVPLLVLACVAALARRDLPAWAIAVSAVAVAVLVERVAWPFAGDAALFQTEPARSVLSRVVLTRVSELVVALVIVAGGVVLALLLRPGARRIALAVATLLLVVQVAQTGYITGKRAEATEGPADIQERTWIDAVADGRPVAIQGEGQVNTPEFRGALRDAQFFNRDVEVFATTEGGLRKDVVFNRHGTVERLDLDDGTGRLRAISGRPLPRLWLVSTLFRPIGMLEEKVRASKYLPLWVVRLRGAPRATWRWSGVEPDGWIGKAQPDVSLRVYPAARLGPGRRCLRITLVAAPTYEGVHRFRVSAPGYERRGALRAEQQGVATVPLTPGVRTIRVQTRGTVEFVPGRELSMIVGATAAVRC